MSTVSTALSRNRPLQAFLYVLAWTALGTMAASQSVITYALQGDQPPVWLIFKLTMPIWYTWAALTPVIFLAAHRFPLRGAGWATHLPAHVALNLTMLLVSGGIEIGVRALLGFPVPNVQAALAGNIQVSVLTYWTVLWVAHGLAYYRESQARMVRTAELTAQLSKARLEALRAQLHPHFLFNTLHAISAFIREEPEKAEVMLAELGELLRAAMDAANEPTVPLSREMEHIDRYLSIQKSRLGDRLHVEVDVSPDLGDARVPNLLLQPLVENAVEHGISNRLGEGWLWIRGSRENGSLCLEVEDDGPGLPDEKLDPANWRVGLRNTRDRLAQLYGPQQRFELVNSDNGGLKVRVLIPLDPSD
ncbi:MAG: histidine kinase [Gemmatimonadota bacterium]|nr:MAG: histidine kinase [Gemmatimonadota bacterium]